MQLFDLAMRANATLSNITSRNLKIIGKFTLKSILVPYQSQFEKVDLCIPNVWLNFVHSGGSLRLMLPHGGLLSMWCASGKPTTATGIDLLLKRHAWGPSLDMIFKATPKNLIGKIFFFYIKIEWRERERERERFVCLI